MFIPFFLQGDLKKEIEKVFENDRFPDIHGNLVKLNIYKQSLPIRNIVDRGELQEDLESGLLDADEIAGELPVPYINIIFPGGVANTRNKPGKVSTMIYIGMYDDRDSREGYQWVVNVIQKICERFSKNFQCGNCLCGEEIEWEVSTGDEHPYYFGYMGLEFETPPVRKENIYE